MSTLLVSWIQPRVSLSHFPRQSASRFYLHQLPFPDSRTPLRCLVPLLLAFHQFRPERKDPALSRLSRMNRTAIGPQEAALRVSGRPQPPKIGGPINELPLKIRGRHAQKRRRSNDIVLGQVNKPLLLAAGDAARLALEAHVRIVTRTLAADLRIHPKYEFAARRAPAATTQILILSENRSDGSRPVRIVMRTYVEYAFVRNPYER